METTHNPKKLIPVAIAEVDLSKLENDKFYHTIKFNTPCCHLGEHLKAMSTNASHIYLEVEEENKDEKQNLKCVQFFYGKECIYPHCKCDPVKTPQPLTPLSEITEEDANKFKELFGYSPQRAIEFLKSKYNIIN